MHPISWQIIRGHEFNLFNAYLYLKCLKNYGNEQQPYSQTHNSLTCWWLCNAWINKRFCAFVYLKQIFELHGADVKKLEEKIQELMWAATQNQIYLGHFLKCQQVLGVLISSMPCLLLSIRLSPDVLREELGITVLPRPWLKSLL